MKEKRRSRNRLRILLRGSFNINAQLLLRGVFDGLKTGVLLLLLSFCFVQVVDQDQEAWGVTFSIPQALDLGTKLVGSGQRV